MGRSRTVPSCPPQSPPNREVEGTKLLISYMPFLRLDSQNAHLWSVRFPSVPMGCSKTFPAGCAQDTGKTAVLALAPTTLETHRIFHESRVRYLHIYGWVRH